MSGSSAKRPIDFNVAGPLGSGPRGLAPVPARAFQSLSFSLAPTRMPMLAHLWAFRVCRGPGPARIYGRQYPAPSGGWSYLCAGTSRGGRSRALIEGVRGAKEVVLVGHDWGAPSLAWYYDAHVQVVGPALPISRPHHHECSAFPTAPWVAEKGVCTQAAGRAGAQIPGYIFFFFQLPWLPEWGRRAPARRAGAVAISATPFRRPMAVDKRAAFSLLPPFLFFPTDVLRVYQRTPAGGDRAPHLQGRMLDYYRALACAGFGAKSTPRPSCDIDGTHAL